MYPWLSVTKCLVPTAGGVERYENPNESLIVNSVIFDVLVELQ